MKVYVSYELPEYDIPEMNEMAATAFKYMMQMHKYMVMWQLRTLEQDINDSQGMIVIHANGRIETKDFTRALTDKIHAILKADAE